MNHPVAASKSERSESPESLNPRIDQLFSLQVRRTPDALALTCGNNHLTYRQLDEKANRLANYLVKQGVGSEIPVLLYFDRSLEMVVAILGVLKAGGTYVPVDRAYPKERLNFMLEDSRAPIILTHQTLRTSLPAAPTPVLSLDADWDEISRESAGAPLIDTTAENAAYIIYTSGSTGKPKGVIVTHHNVVRLLQQTAHWYGFNGSDVWPLFHSYAFDVSVWELWGSLFHGGRLVIVPYLVSRSPADFYQLLVREKVTVLNQTPSAFRQLIWAQAALPVPGKLYLRYVICAGEALELQSLKPWFERHGDETPQVINMYGITETTVHTTFRRIRQADVASGVGSVIGVPIPDLSLHLVDEKLQPVPRGAPGEICVGGAGVARGYLNRPELTSRRFIPDPFSSTPGAHLYRSGDLARYSETGELEYLGRMDHQVKIRGFRVELGEIESALNRHQAIRESVVVARDLDTGDKQLVAYIVPHKSSPNVSELRLYLLDRIPEYMVPAVFISLKALPLTTNGKVDRRALPEPEGSRPALDHQFVAPRNRTEEGLANIWSEVLGVDTIGVHDNFFELGGDSIRSITIISEARRLGWNLSVQQVFENPTVASLASSIQKAGAETARKPSQPFDLISSEERATLPPDVEDAYPLTKLQMGMFYYNELDPESAIYHDVFSFQVAAVFDWEKLGMAIHRVAERHPVLRTSFHLARFSEPLQLVHRQVQIPSTFEDLRQLDRAAQEHRIVEWVEVEKRTPFDRAKAPLVRFHTQLHTDCSFQFFMSFHHACVDGWSLAAVITEIFQQYIALLRGVDSPTDPPCLGYRDFVLLEQEAFRSEAQRRFWTEKLKDANLALLPRWPKSFCSAGKEQVRGPEIHISQEVFRGLRQLAKSAGVPLKTVLLAAHQRVLCLLHGRSNVTTGLICNGRPEQTDGEKLVGLFLNSLPLRSQLNGGSWLELVKQTFTAEQELLPYRWFPLAKIQKLHGGQPLFETAFDFVHFHVYKGLQGHSQFDLKESHYFEANNLTTYTTFMLDVTSTHLEFHIHYDPNLLCHTQIDQLSNYYLRTLEAMAADPTAHYDSFVPLSDSERLQILVDYNQTAEDYPCRESVENLFEQHATETPNAIALVFGSKKFTYRELDDKATRLAARLQKFGAAPGILVGLCIERSVDMVIALLAVLKTGGAYVPLDPAYPAERLAFMVEDSKLPILLTQNDLLPLLGDNLAAGFSFDAPFPDSGLRIGTKSPHDSIAPLRDSPPELAPSDSSAPLAYVIYTSGSTGQPKGVQITRRSVVNLLTSIARKTNVTARDNLLAVTTLSFDIAALEIFLPLITGGTLTLAGRKEACDGTQLAALTDSSGATLMQGTPATWRILLEAGWAGNPNLKAFCGGETLPHALADSLLERTRELWNFYGPTETTIWSSACKVERHGPVSIGKPLANTQFYILDATLSPVPLGTPGELHIGGDGLALGYLNRPELTAEKFVTNPFAPNTSARLYKSGDLARYLPDGSVEWLGRLDHQVKVRGFRIELGEIESVLRQHQSIADALVTTSNDSFGEKRLVGYVTSRNGPPSAADLRDFIRTKLPPYMVPAQFVVLNGFPLTPNGKVDRSQLPAPEANAETSAAYVAPRDPREQGLAQIWQQVLSLQRIGIDDNFFELGGDSLSATRAFARINKRFGHAITLQNLFEHPTIRALGELVGKGLDAPLAPRPTIPRQPRAFEVH